jgi:hypothetical protein
MSPFEIIVSGCASGVVDIATTAIVTLRRECSPNGFCSSSLVERLENGI